MITILVKAADGTLIASAQSADDARLCIDRVYEDGDTVEILADEKHLCVQMDVILLPGEVYLPNGRMTWRVPAGEHRLAYAPGAFEAKRHVITARPMTAGGNQWAARYCLQSGGSARRNGLLPPYHRECRNAQRGVLLRAQRHQRTALQQLSRRVAVRQLGHRRAGRRVVLH